MKATKIVALVLGVLGGLLEIGATLGIGALGGLGAALGVERTGVIFAHTVIMFILAVLGIIGAAITLVKPGTAAILMLIAGIGGSLVAFPFGIPGGILLFIGGVLALIGRKDKETIPPTVIK